MNAWLLRRRAFWASSNNCEGELNDKRLRRAAAGLSLNGAIQLRMLVSMIESVQIAAEIPIIPTVGILSICVWNSCQ
jgi:hypothetical protein